MTGPDPTITDDGAASQLEAGIRRVRLPDDRDAGAGASAAEPQVRALTVSRVYRADLDDVWDACTNAERIPRWFLPVTGDLHLHGWFQLEGNAGGTIEACEPPSSFTATWEFGGATSRIVVRLASEAGGTRLELTHEIPVDPGHDEMWAQFGPGAVGVGWDGCLMGLGLHLASGETVDPAAAAAWMASEAGRQFYRASSRKWRDASVAAGTDPAVADAAAEQTTQAYTATG